MSEVRGPFLEFECTRCGRTVQANAPSTQERLTDTVADLNANPDKRICARCWKPDEDPTP